MLLRISITFWNYGLWWVLCAVAGPHRAKDDSPKCCCARCWPHHTQDITIVSFFIPIFINTPLTLYFFLFILLPVHLNRIKFFLFSSVFLSYLSFYIIIWSLGCRYLLWGPNGGYRALPVCVVKKWWIVAVDGWRLAVALNDGGR